MVVSLGGRRTKVKKTEEDSAESTTVDTAAESKTPANETKSKKVEEETEEKSGNRLFTLIFFNNEAFFLSRK